MTYTEKATDKFNETKEALTTVYTELNKGQQQKLLKNEKVKALLVFMVLLKNKKKGIII